MDGRNDNEGKKAMQIVRCEVKEVRAIKTRHQPDARRHS